MGILVIGGAGFIGANLCRYLLGRGYRLTVLDNFSTGRPANLEGLALELIEGDICAPPALPGPFRYVVNLASPASPPAYQSLALETLAAGSQGVWQALDIARRYGARFLQASTSEVYGDPQVHPQPESYRGCVSCTGPRAMYDESKRFAEALIINYAQRYDTSVTIARIFNTYGPYMRPDDGRVVTNFLSQIKRGQPLTIYGQGEQTRSFCYVEDLIQGLERLLLSTEPGPINLGNPQEISMLQLAQTALEVTGGRSPLSFKPLPPDDPARRCPDITLARARLGWEPKIPLRQGLKATWEYLQGQIV